MKRIYLDYAASTPVREEVVEVMKPYWTSLFGNASSIHQAGRQADQAIQNARHTVATSLGATDSEILFTSCGSESDNLALRGVMHPARKHGRGNHLITSVIEHKAVLDTAYQLRDLHGFDLTVVPVDAYGRVQLDQLERAIRADTVLISIMAANNEIGTCQPVREIGEIARRHSVLFHTDAIQAAVAQQFNLSNMPIDLLSLSAHKFYGPKGIGMLYVRQGVDITPQLTGGGQEGGLRAGTSNTPLIVGAAEALRLATAELDDNVAHYLELRDRLIKGVLEAFPADCRLTGHPTERLPHHASFAFRHLSGNDLLIHLDAAGISASSGSACLTGDPSPSSVLEALSLDPDWTKGGLRLTVGTPTTAREIEILLDQMPDIVSALRHFAASYA